MKNYLKTGLSVAVCLALLLSCAEEKETALNISDVRGNATVKGKVEYNAGLNIDAENIAEYMAPVAGKTVYFYLEIESLLGAPNEGRLTYSTTTDTNGEYSITLPATADGLIYTVSLESFEVERWVVNDGANAADVPYVQKSYFYQTPTLTGDINLVENLDVYRYSALTNPTLIQ